MKVSVIIAAGRSRESLSRCVDSLVTQVARVPIEILLVGTPEGSFTDQRVRIVREEDLNPAIRRNRGAQEASGGVLAFIDDDATAAPDWLTLGLGVLESDPAILAVGGPDPAPADSTISELFSDTLLVAPWIGSGVLCHSGPPGVREVRSPHDLALVNLIIRRDAFERAGGFDESIGYIGEDSALLAKLIGRGRVIYCGSMIVYHRRRAFPADYVRQRWRYRVKMGRSLLRKGSLYRSNRKIWLFLGAGALFIALSVLLPAAGIVLFSVYVVTTLTAGTARTRLPVRWWPLIPVAFMIHHGTYFSGIVWGMIRSLTERRTAPAEAVAETKER